MCSAISNELWNRHDRTCQEVETVGANGDDNCAIISFIFVGTSSSPFIRRIAQRTHFDVLDALFPIVYWIVPPSPPSTMASLLLLLLFWLFCDSSVQRAEEATQKKNQTKENYVGQLFLGHVAHLCRYSRIIIMSKIVIQHKEWTNGKP